MSKGLFVTFEGVEGGGKSTVGLMLVNHLKDRGYNVISLREPGGTPIGEEIRHTLKHSQNGDSLTYESELLLMNASRAQLVNQVIQPALNDGKIVFCDRFYDSTTAYQGYGRELDLSKVQTVIDLAVNGLKPDLTCLFDVSQEDSDANLQSRLSTLPFVKDRFEEADRAFFQRVRRGYEEIITKEPDRVKRVSFVRNNSTAMLEQVLSYLDPLMQSSSVPKSL